MGEPLWHLLICPALCGGRLEPAVLGEEVLIDLVASHVDY